MADMTEAKRMWSDLLTGWVDQPIPGEETQLWRKKCCAVTFYLEVKGRLTYEFVAESDEQVCVKEEFTAKDLVEAKGICDRYIGEFLETAFETWFGHKAEFTCPPTEIRIKQAFTFQESRGEHSIMGIGEDGKLYYFDGSGWRPRSMKIAA